jgi:hypothetical protein
LEAGQADMKSYLYLIQEAANLQHIEQAVDAALVAAIFDSNPVLLFLNQERSEKEITNTDSVHAKIAQLKEMQITFLNAATMDKSAISKLFNQADIVLTY